MVGFLWLAIGTFVVFSRVPEEEEPDADTGAANAATFGQRRSPGEDDWPDAFDGVTVV